MGRNLGTPAVKIPDNPIWIDFPRSDGRRQVWPANTTYIEDEEGHINWMKQVEIDHPIAIKWRLTVGHAIAVDRGLSPPESAILRNWPADYNMYDHHKGPARGNVRHDIYLFGGPARFRSPMEFVPHAIWLSRDDSLNRDNCNCKYCKGVSQTLITSTLSTYMNVPKARQASARADSTSISAAGPSTSTSAPAPGRDIYSALQKKGWARRERDRDAVSLAKRRAQREKRMRQEAKGKGKEGAEGPPKVYAAVQQPLEPVAALEMADNIIEHPVLAARNRDLRAVYSRRANDKMGVASWDDADDDLAPIAGTSHLTSGPDQGDPPLRRWFRDGEVVWVRLPGEGIPLTSLGAEPGSAVKTWPGVVKSSRVKNTPVPVPQLLPPANAPAPVSGLQAQGKQLDSLFATQGPALNGHSAGESLRSSQLPASSQPFYPQPTPTLPFSRPTSNVTIPSAVPSTSSTSLPPANSAYVPSAAADSPSATPAFPPLPSRPGLSTTSTTPARASGGGWVVKESWIYTIELLAVNVRVEAEPESVLPYLADPPSQSFIDWMQTNPRSVFDFNMDKISVFDPMAVANGALNQTGKPEQEILETTCAALSAYALALQAAARVCHDWSLTDKWEFQYLPPEDGKGYLVPKPASGVVRQPSASMLNQASSVSPSPSQRPGTSPEREGLSLSAAIEAASRSNAQDVMSSPPSKKPNLNEVHGSRPIYEEVSGMSNMMGEEELKRLKDQVLGVEPTAVASSSTPATRSGKPQPLTQMRFQGMWWGSERIWTDDFVRIKLARGALAPEGAPHVYEASQWGKRTMENFEKLKQMLAAKDKGKGKEGEGMSKNKILDGIIAQGSKSRGVFMKISAIFVVEVLDEEGKLKKEGRVSGTLYELAELDWEETVPELKEQLEREKAQRIAILKRRTEVEEATALFSASVDEDLLPTSPKKARDTPPPSLLEPATTLGNYLIPQAPKGYRFRPILKPGYEAVLNLSLISGRYYPRILSHPLLLPIIIRSVEEVRQDEEAIKQQKNLMSLECLAPGHLNSVDPTHYKRSRDQIFNDAERGALSDMQEHQENGYLDEYGSEEEDPEDEDGDMLEDDERMDEDEDAMNVD